MWTKEVAQIWSNYVPPCRPSRFELDKCTEIIHKIRSFTKAKPSVLILGSTTEYRDWAFEEYCDISVIDNSMEYHLEISNSIRYKNHTEQVFYQKWQDMTFVDKYDLIVGDLIIGNLRIGEVGPFIEKISNALTPNGYFLTKSFHYNQNKPIIEPVVFFENYENNFNFLDPFPFNAYNLAMYSMDATSNILQFGKMFDVVVESYDKGLISSKTLNRYTQFGWQDLLKSDFYTMPVADWEKVLYTHFSSVYKAIGPYFWSDDFPYYISTNSKLQ